jgi:GNAT superfamily N-acetyltransferase
MKNLALHDLHGSNIASAITEIINIENQVYEPARRDSYVTLARIACSGRSIGAVCTHNGQIVGFSLAARLESFLHVNGCREDCQSGRDTTLYSADIAVAESHRGQHIGFLLKIHQIYRAKLAGYGFISSRNRASLAVEMLGINECVGAKIAARIGNAYRDQSASRDALYLKLQLGQVSVEQLTAQLRPAAVTAFDSYVRGQRPDGVKI